MKCAKYLQACARHPLRASGYPTCNARGLCPADCRRRLYFATSPYPHVELNKDGTSYFIRCGLPRPRWYQPELPVGPARAAAPAAPISAAPDYRTAYAVHSAALPNGATSALPDPPDPTPVGAPTAPGAIHCIQQHRCGGTGCIRADRGDGLTLRGSRGAHDWRWRFCTRTSATSPRASDPKPPGKRIGERRD